ncbi:ATP-binding protein [Delftia sp. K82]|uniref:ATP-binding protein n=1 Tax=Delftia sp. K82 TaxID=1472718 RepID=UPI000B490647|nr:ATP-binding protein [Delftia sp. K82]
MAFALAIMAMLACAGHGGRDDTAPATPSRSLGHVPVRDIQLFFMDRCFLLLDAAVGATHAAIHTQAGYAWPWRASAAQGQPGPLHSLMQAGRALPESLLLRKSANNAGWLAGRWEPARQLVRAHVWLLLGSVSLGLAFMAALAWCVRRLRRGVPASAWSRAGACACAAGDALCRKLLDTAPVGLALVRCSDRSLLLSNGLARQWVCSDSSWLEHAVAEGAQQGRRELVLGDGRLVEVSTTHTSHAGEPVVFCLVSDVTALRQAQAALVDAKLRAESASQAKTQFLATMSHEIRTPLFGILGTLELLALSRAPSEQTRYLGAMQQASASLLRIVNDSLDLSAIEAGRLQLEAHAFSATELLDSVAAGLLSRAEQKGLQLYAVSDVKTPPLLVGDALRLRQILDNLVGNAIKFTFSGHVAIRLQVMGDSEEGTDLRFQVQDTGIGIEPEQQPFLFDPYFRAHAATQQQVQGAGLGLSICLRLSQEMGGRLTAASQPGLGTCVSFELRLPRESAAGYEAVPSLLPQTVYVDGAIPEVVHNLCAWLRHWGAMAQPYRDQVQGSNEQAVLVQAWPRSVRRPQWTGKCVVALAPGEVPRETLQARVWETSMPGVLAVGQALGMAQQGIAPGARPDLYAAVPQVHEPMGLSVLIVEDNPINRIILREQLQVLGCEVQQASNGQDALSMPGLLEFDAVLTDLHMPLLDGLALARALRKRGYGRPIVGLTANAQPQGQTQTQAQTQAQGQGDGLPAGFDSLLCKPFTLAVLRTTLNHIKQCRT